MIKNAHLASPDFWKTLEYDRGPLTSEFTTLYEILCSPARGTINIKATLQGEIFSEEDGIGA